MERTFSKEFKIMACKMVMNGEAAHAVVAEKLGINKNMLYRWLDEYKTLGDDAFVGKGHLHTSDRELKKLQKENERLRMENEILKKAAAYFAKHPADE